MTDSLFLRSTELKSLEVALAEGACCSIVGLSNVGKSALLRAAAEANARTESALYVYVDCNSMLALTDQAFYQVTLRAALDAVKRLGKKVSADLVTRVEALYQTVIEADKPIVAALSFNDGVALLCEQLQRRVALLFDEFDDPFGALEGRVFLNLRALHDKYQSLVYVTATGMPLTERRHDIEAGEFCELFVGHQITLSLLSDKVARQAAAHWSADDGAALDRRLDRGEIDFVIEQAGGHPGLLRTTTRLVVRVSGGTPIDSRTQALTLARERLESDSVIRNECAKLWGQLSPLEQEALLNFLSNEGELPGGAVQADLVAKGLIVLDSTPRVFGRLFAGYAYRQRRTRQPAATGVHIDLDAGEVWVDGGRIPTLTDLEYRLLLLLYGRLSKLCDKYQIVEAVWGQDYIDEVDDARIEKLISRLRSKLERDPANPKYLQTVRGRGYKLTSA
jgi:DNA-binding winged helix-turn-helix (wHTH) protein